MSPRDLLRFIVFRNVFIGLCAVSMVWVTNWFFNLPLRVDALVLFVFFATFFEYNLHAVAWRVTLSKPFDFINQLYSPSVSPVLRGCILAGFTGSLITFVLLPAAMMLAFFIAGVLTLAYSIPLIKRNQGFIRVREITYMKVFTVALGWSLVTVLIPILPILSGVSMNELVVIFLRRFLFIYAITIPFEIRDMERERRFGNRSLPMIYGVNRMKSVGIMILLMFCLLSAIHEKYFLFELDSRTSIFYPLLCSALAAAFLVLFASEKRNNWYYKFWTDGTMILQLVLLLLFNL